MKQDIKQTIEIPEGITFTVDGNVVSVKGPKGDLQDKFFLDKISLTKEENNVIFESKKASKKQKALIGTFSAKIRNMFTGVSKGFEYKLQVCSSHFPMTVNIQGNELLVKNFLGERVDRKAKLLEGVNVSLKGDIILVSGISKEAVGQTSRNIEVATIVRGRDIRVFQDGIYLIEKSEASETDSNKN